MRLDQHFNPNEHQYSRKPDFQVAKVTERAGQQEVKRTQTENGEHV